MRVAHFGEDGEGVGIEGGEGCFELLHGPLQAADQELDAREYSVSEADILDCVDFPDAIGVNGWPVEAHVAGDVDFRFARCASGFNQLPYRMLLPLGVDNLLVAGRCASMTHDGQSSARVSGPCFVMGQAAGAAAQLALLSGKPPRYIDVQVLQEKLEHDGAYLGSDLVTQ